MAIIAVLVAISIPVFSGLLEKSRQTADLANMRSAYAEAMTDYLSGNGDGGISSVYTLLQKDPDEGLFDDVDYSSAPDQLYLAIYNAGLFDDGSTTEYVVYVVPSDGSHTQWVFIGSLTEAKAAVGRP